MEKFFAVLIIAIALITGCGMMAGRAVQRTPLPPSSVVTVPDASELERAGAFAIGLQAGETVTRPLTVTVPVSVSVALFPPVEDNREAQAQTIWRVTFAGALGLILIFLAVVGVISYMALGR